MVGRPKVPGELFMVFLVLLYPASFRRMRRMADAGHGEQTLDEELDI
jgi:hypothetical protein